MVDEKDRDGDETSWVDMLNTPGRQKAFHEFLQTVWYKTHDAKDPDLATAFNAFIQTIIVEEAAERGRNY